MAVTPGSKDQMNSVVGYARIVPVTDAEYTTTLKDKVFKPGTMMQLADGKVLIADGTTPLKDLPVRIDQTLVKVEKDALQAAFSTGNYVAAANGVVVHGTDGKIDDASLKLVADGKLVASYLSDFVDEDGKIKLSVLPASVRAGISYFATYSDMNTKATDENKLGACFVIDATDDPSGKVGKGAAVYVWLAGEDGEDGSWNKFAEVESLDIDIDALKPDYDNVQAAGAIMYDHPVCLGGMTLTELASLEDAASGEEESDA